VIAAHEFRLTSSGPLKTIITLAAPSLMLTALREANWPRSAPQPAGFPAEHPAGGRMQRFAEKSATLPACSALPAKLYGGSNRLSIKPPPPPDTQLSMAVSKAPATILFDRPTSILLPRPG